MKKFSKILLVGGTGFIGFHIADILIKKKYKVFSFSKKKPKKNRKVKKVIYILGDICNKKNINKLNNYNFDYVINLAGYVDHSNKEKVLNSHYLGVKNIVEYFNQKKIKLFIQIGSSTEYGSLKSPHNELYKINIKKLNSHYSIAKNKATRFMFSNYKKNKLPFTIVRPYLLYGPNQDTNRIIPFVINQCLNKKKFPCSTGNQIRNFLHINDFSYAILKILKLIPNREIINIGFDRSYSVKFIIKKINKFIKSGSPQFGLIPLRKDETIKIFPNIKKSKKLLDWKPKITINAGLKNTIKFYATKKKN